MIATTKLPTGMVTTTGADWQLPPCADATIATWPSWSGTRVNEKTTCPPATTPTDGEPPLADSWTGVPSSRPLADTVTSTCSPGT